VSLADDVASGVLPRATARSARCSVCRWLDGQEPRDRDAFDQWLADVAAGVEGRTVADLWRLCRHNGLTVGRRRFAEHVSECHVAS